MKALQLSVYSNPAYRHCANGGVSETADSIYVACESGPYEVEETNPLLFKLKASFNEYACLVPYTKPKGAEIGPMMGGNYAGTSDSRFADMVYNAIGSTVGILPIHDRYESKELYETLSR